MPNEKVPNQREITISKQLANKENLYTINNLSALNEAACRLQSKGGFKLYMYLAKNQDKYSFNLSSRDFLNWSGLGYAAYTTAFDELIKNGYLIPKDGAKSVYTFFDKAQKEDENSTIIEIPKEKVEEIRKITGTIYKH